MTRKYISARHSIPAMAAVAIMIFSGCQGNKTDSDASRLLDEATGAYQAADYSRATLLLDSLQKTFPAEIDIQREGMTLRPKVIEKATLLKISTNDSLMALDKLDADRIKPRLKWVKNPRMIEGYWTASQGYNPSFMNSTGIQGRVSEIGEFYIVSSVNPSSLHHTSISVSNGIQSASTPEVPYDGESNYRLDGSEIITFSPAQSDTIGKFTLANAQGGLTLTFKGKSAKSMKLSQAQVAAIADCYAYAKAVARARQLAVERQRLEATLQVARDQIARTTPETK